MAQFCNFCSRGSHVACCFRLSGPNFGIQASRCAKVAPTAQHVNLGGMPKKDVELAVLHPQALHEIHAERDAAQRAAAEAADEAIRQRNLAERERGVVPLGNAAAIRRVGETIRYSPALTPWMCAYAEWLTLGNIAPTWTQKVTKARGLSRAPVSRKQLVLLEARPDFLAYVRDLESGPLERARARFQSAFPEYVEAHKEALDKARDANDYAAVARIAEPVLDRVLPKKTDGGGATQVSITLSASQLAGISASYTPPKMLVDEVVADVVPE